MNTLENETRELYKNLTLKLIEKNLSITTMESATSGQIASLITDTEGSSAIMKGAFITYSNEAKIKCGVPASVIEKYGVYSKETAREMALAAKEQYDADISIGVTGSLGNVDPVNADSIPGQVYYSIIFKDEICDYFQELDTTLSRHDSKLFIAREICSKIITLLVI